MVYSKLKSAFDKVSSGITAAVHLPVTQVQRHEDITNICEAEFIRSHVRSFAWLDLTRRLLAAVAAVLVLCTFTARVWDLMIAEQSGKARLNYPANIYGCSRINVK